MSCSSFCGADQWEAGEKPKRSEKEERKEGNPIYRVLKRLFLYKKNIRCVFFFFRLIN